MNFTLLAFALQLLGSSASVKQLPSASISPVDSVRLILHARASQSSFERRRRTELPIGHRTSGPCDVVIGRFCWYYDARKQTFPPEHRNITRWRKELLSELDSASAHLPGDDWLAGMRVYYRVDGGDLQAADSAAKLCASSEWWCAAVAGYVAHAGNRAAAADSMFKQAVRAMPPSMQCGWSDISPLLRGDDRDAYSRLACDARAAMASRFWLLSRPRLASAANELENEFYARRALSWLAARATTLHLLRWGDDTEELVLRYGWPVAWSRLEGPAYGSTLDDPGVIGHDPSPSFVFTPERWRSDSLTKMQTSDWRVDDRTGESRYAPHQVERIIPVVAQVARFRRGDSTLVVAVYAAGDDSLRSPAALLAMADTAGVIVAGSFVPAARGVLRVASILSPFLVGVEIHDSTTRTLARSRETFVNPLAPQALALSDLLVYRPGENPAASLDSALAYAVAGDTVTRTQSVGLFWETYGISSAGDALDITVSVERVDRSWFRGARQRIGLAPQDTPIRIRWTDARPPANQAAAHAISLDLGNLDAGRYRVTLSLTSSTGAQASSVREIQLIER